MIDRVSEIRSRWQRVEPERPPQRRKGRSRFPFQKESESDRKRAPEAGEPEDQVHISVRI